MTAAMAHFSIEQYHRYFVTGVVPGTTDRGRVSQSFAFACGDGALIAIHLSSPVKFWDGFVRALDAPELAQDARFATRMDRVRNHEALEAALRPIFASRPRAEWLLRLAAADVPHAPIHDLERGARRPADAPPRRRAHARASDGRRRCARCARRSRSTAQRQDDIDAAARARRARRGDPRGARAAREV